MGYAIIGFGAIGQALARAFASRGRQKSGELATQDDHRGALVEARADKSWGPLIFQDLFKP